MNQKKENLITDEGKKDLEKKLKYLIEVRRPDIIKQIQAAREQGDLSENADYDAAKNQQAQIEAQIKELETILSNYKVIEADASKHQKKNKGAEQRILIGSTVKLKDYSDQKNYVYRIVGSIEADPSENKISNECPLAKSIIGKKVNDEVIIKGVEKPYWVKILEISAKK